MTAERLHEQVFGQLPAQLARRLDEPQVATVVAALVEDGWRPAQLAARVAVLPVTSNQTGQVLDFLRALLGEQSPRSRVEQERRMRQQAAEVARALAPQPASPQSREHWLAEARRGLKGLPRRTAAPVSRIRPSCALCAAEASFFVTHEVHLCRPCVQVLGTGKARLTSTG